MDDDAQAAVDQALDLVGRFDEARMREIPVVVKVGVFNHKARRTNYPTVEVVGGITNAFNEAEKIYWLNLITIRDQVLNASKFGGSSSLKESFRSTCQKTRIRDRLRLQGRRWNYPISSSAQKSS